MQRKISLFAASAIVLAALAACGGGGGDGGSLPAAQPTGDTVIVTASGRVKTFNRATPGSLTSDQPITGLNQNETFVGIDVRPADGILYGVTTLGRIFTIDASTGGVVLKSTLTSDAASPTAFAGLAGTSFAVDFNPVPDRLRVVSNTGQNLRINVDTGAVLVDGAVTGATAVTAAAYTNSFPGTTTTQLYTIDCGAGQRYLQNPPNNGTQTNPVALGVTCTGANGFDIDPRTNLGYAALIVGGNATLYTVPVGTAAAATLVGVIGGGQEITGLALLKNPTNPTVFVLSSTNTLSRIDPNAPNTLQSSNAISGLNAGERVLGIDFRPANGLLYALTSTGRLLTVNPDTGAGTFVANLAADPADTTLPYTALSGSTFAVDFNPVADRLRVISDNGQSLRINVATGATTTDGTINRASGAASVVAAAYTNSFPGTTATTLYDIDATADQLAIQAPPNDGTLTNVGALGIDVTGTQAFDIGGGDNGLALAALRSGTTGPYSLYNVALSTGVATLRGTASAAQIGGASGPAIVDIAIRY